MVPPKHSSKEPKAMDCLLHSHYANRVWFKELLLPASPSAVRALGWHHGALGTMVVADRCWHAGGFAQRQEVSGKAGSSPSCWWKGFWVTQSFMLQAGGSLLHTGVLHIYITKIKECNSWLHDILVLIGRKTTAMLCSKVWSEARPKMWRLPLWASYCVLKQGDKDLQSPPRSVKACLPTVSGSDEMQQFHNWCCSIDQVLVTVESAIPCLWLIWDRSLSAVAVVVAICRDIFWAPLIVLFVRHNY